MIIFSRIVKQKNFKADFGAFHAYRSAIKDCKTPEEKLQILGRYAEKFFNTPAHKNMIFHKYISPIWDEALSLYTLTLVE
jgi:hypothetical protein